MTTVQKEYKQKPSRRRLNPKVKGVMAAEFEQKLREKVIGQDRAVRKVVSLYQKFLAETAAPGRPIGNLLFLGPTGSGKTHIVEAAAEILFGNPKAFTKIDCAEFQHEHEIAKLIGSPPGYMGHKQTPGLLCQMEIDKYQKKDCQLTLILFDEIEKADLALHQILLGIMDKGTMNNGDNTRSDFSKCIIFMTSNLGARPISENFAGGLGFAPPPAASMTEARLDKKIYKEAMVAAKRKFSPEFMNRVDKVVVFHPLHTPELKKILDIELRYVQDRIMNSKKRFVFRCSDAAKVFLLNEGTDLKNGARPLKRTLERFLVEPFSNMAAGGEINQGDLVSVDFEDGIIVFDCYDEGALVAAVTTKDQELLDDIIGEKKVPLLLPKPKDDILEEFFYCGGK